MGRAPFWRGGGNTFVTDNVPCFKGGGFSRCKFWGGGRKFHLPDYELPRNVEKTSGTIFYPCLKHKTGVHECSSGTPSPAGASTSGAPNRHCVCVGPLPGRGRGWAGFQGGACCTADVMTRDSAEKREPMVVAGGGPAQCREQGGFALIHPRGARGRGAGIAWRSRGPLHGVGLGNSQTEAQGVSLK